MTGQQLKNSILQMAVQGKLVPQDPNDEPASVLLEKIRAEKETLIKAGKIKKEKNPSVIFRGSDNLPYEKIGKEVKQLDVPFDIPDSWEWVRLGDLFTNKTGLSYKKESLNIKSEKQIRVLRGGNIGEESYYFKDDDIFISEEFVKPELYLKKNYLITPAVSSLENIGKIALINNDYNDTVVGGFVLMLIPFLDNTTLAKYLLFSFATNYHRDNCRKITHKSGQAFYNISREKLMNLYIPLPSLAEQCRIVAKIEELLPHINAYDEKEKELKSFNISFPEKLKKSILQDAVQGKLVPQDPNDEPASVLLEKIRSEKKRLIAEGKIKKDKNESIIFRRDNSHYEKLGNIERCIDDELPFEIPNTWEWTRFKNVIELISGQDLTPDKYNAFENGIPYITGASNIENDSVKINRWTSFGKTYAYKDDILITCKGTIGEIAVLKEKMAHIARQIMAIRATGDLNKAYIIIVLSALVESFKIAAKSIIPGITRDDVLNSFIPVPPLIEQHRIVSKIEEILPIIKSM